MSTIPVREDMLKAFRARIANGMWAPGLEIANTAPDLAATADLWLATPQEVGRVLHAMADEGLLERTEYGWKVPGVTPNGYAYPPTTEGAVARIQAYLDATPDVFNVGGDMAYGEQFRSEEWPRGVYTPTRPDVEELLRALRQAQAEAHQYRTALQGVARRSAEKGTDQ